MAEETEDLLCIELVGDETQGPEKARAPQYHSPRNKFERFRGFLELISRFEFDFRRHGFFFERFEFLVCSKFNHTQSGRTCACAVASLYPPNSISNVVASVTIHDDMCIHIKYL